MKMWFHCSCISANDLLGYKRNQAIIRNSVWAAHSCSTSAETGSHYTRGNAVKLDHINENTSGRQKILLKVIWVDLDDEVKASRAIYLTVPQIIYVNELIRGKETNSGSGVKSPPSPLASRTLDEPHCVFCVLLSTLRFFFFKDCFVLVVVFLF